MENKNINITKSQSILIAAIIYGVLIGVNFDPKVTEAQAKVVGDLPFNIPVRAFFITVMAVLFLPIFLVSGHFLRITSYAISKGVSVRGFSILKFIFFMNREHPKKILKSKNVFLLSLLYFIALLLAWTLWAAVKLA